MEVLTGKNNPERLREVVKQVEPDENILEEEFDPGTEEEIEEVFEPVQQKRKTIRLIDYDF